MDTLAPVLVAPDVRWDAVRRRDPTADGSFFYAVATTGVYCRPSCGSRPARPENVRFYDTRAEAERAGYRPCKRCRPDLAPRAEREATLITEACRSIEAAEELPSLAELAEAAGLSAFHFHKLFKRIAGVTPKAYASAHRAARVRSGLRTGARVTDTIYDAGFNSAGRFYDAADGMLGMTPTAFRAGGQGEIIHHAVGHSSLGSVLVAATERGVCAILLGDDPADLLIELRRRFPSARLEPGFGDWIERAVALVDAPGRAKGLGLPLDIQGTAFQRKVWEALRTIPAGTTLSYAEVAAQVGNPKAVRAVAGACAANKLAVAVPCHRVIGSDGGLGGYRWGVERKRRLLERERA